VERSEGSWAMILVSGRGGADEEDEGSLKFSGASVWRRFFAGWGGV
jgi:hypothetical protein